MAADEPNPLKLRECRIGAGTREIFQERVIEYFVF